jgi:hypothetical protein
MQTTLGTLRMQTTLSTYQMQTTLGTPQTTLSIHIKCKLVNYTGYTRMQKHAKHCYVIG